MRRIGVLGVLVVGLTSACATTGLAFEQDGRVDVIAPDDRSAVSLPLTVRWTADELPPGTSFGVAVDAAPPRPGSRPDEDAQVVRTTATEVTLDRLGTTSRAGGRGLHRITVFLLDADGKRLGEGAWPIDVELEARR